MSVSIPVTAWASETLADLSPVELAGAGSLAALVLAAIVLALMALVRPVAPRETLQERTAREAAEAGR